MAYEITAPNTGTSLATADAASIRALWDKKIAIHDQTSDFFASHEGMRDDAMIEVRNDTAKGAGSRITFTSMAGFYGEGKHGDENFETSSDFEKAVINSNTLYVDWLRNGTRWSKRMESHMGIQHEVSNKFPDEMGKWAGRTKSERMWMLFREKGSAANYVVAGGGGIDDIGSADTLSWEGIVETGTIMKTSGARPAFMGKVNSNPVHRYLIAGSATGLLGLKQDDQYLEALENASVDSAANTLFTGGFADVDGHCLREFIDIDHDGDGAIGSPINPKLKLASAVAGGELTFDMTGGTDTTKHYTKFFPLHDFKFNESDVFDASASSPMLKGSFYVLVKNPPNAATDPGKFGFYKCSANDGNKITVEERLCATADEGGIAADDVGDVTWDTGVWAGKHTVTHPAGAVAYLANSKGQPIGFTLFAGAQAARRGYGEYRNHRATDTKEAGFINETYVWSVFGQAPVQRTDGEFPNFKMLIHALNYPGLGLPTIV